MPESAPAKWSRRTWWRFPSAPICAWPSSAPPAYFATRAVPRTPQDLTAHRCINLRLPTHGGLYAWEFEKHGRELRVRVEGPLVFNATAPMREAALAGFGLAYLPEDEAQPHIAAGRLIHVLADWCPPYAGYHLYYPSRRQPTPAFAALVEALRQEGRKGRTSF